MQSLPTRLLELASSMRFAVSLLTVIAIASIAGTVVRQGEPYAAYVNQFGPFWFRAFEETGIYAVYNAPWFIAILAFLVASVSVCLWRNAPWMVREMANFRAGRRADAIRLLPHHAELPSPAAPAAAAERAAAYLRARGFACRLETAGDATRLAAKSGSANRLGYLLAHTAVAAICIGGLLDSNVPLQLKLWLGEKRPLEGNVLLSQVPPSARLGAGSLSFRGNSLVPEGGSTDVTVLNVGDGILVQDLPFRIALRKFHIEHYSSGQPKLFASDVVVTDKESGESFETRIEVNRPLVYRGIAAYQASFDDGGTQLKLRGHGLLAPLGEGLALEARVGETLDVTLAGEPYRVELTGFRLFNVENLATAAAEERPEAGLLERLRRQLGTGREALTPRELRNVGPSFTYKLRDAAGQAREYHNYMLPVLLEERWVALSGMRESPNEGFRYLRIPIDAEGGLEGFWMLRGALLDARLRPEIARRFARAAMRGDAVSQTMRERLAESAERVLETFGRRGYVSVAEFLERAVPEAEREQAADIYLRVLQGTAWEAWQYARQRAGLPAGEFTAERARFVQDALNAVSDSFHYGPPLYVALAEFDQVQASVFQMTRSPGKNIVYVGCALLVLGVFALLYVRERRAWLVLEPGRALLGMQCNRRTLEFDREFAELREGIAARLARKEASTGTGAGKD